MRPMCCSLLLAAMLLVATVAAAPGDLCAEAAEAGGAERGEWEQLADGLLPEDVLNATLAAFEDEYVVNRTPGSPGAWVPCAEDERLADVEAGCQQLEEGGGSRYQLRLNLTCLHAEHTDSAAFEVLVTQAPDGQLSVNISSDSVALQVDEAHTEAPPCADRVCLVCTPGGKPAPGSPPLPETCLDCGPAYVVGASGACELQGAGDAARKQGDAEPEPAADEPAPMLAAAPGVIDSGGADGAPPMLGAAAGAEDAAAAEPAAFAARIEDGPAYTAPAAIDAGSQTSTFVPPMCVMPGACRQISLATADRAKPCGVGWYIVYQAPGVAWCMRCSRPGCTDCVACQEGDPGCRSGQWCIGSCSWSFLYRQGGCLPCGQLIAGCSNCVDCTFGSDPAANRMCHVGVRCLGCQTGWVPSGDGTARCKRAW